MLAKQLVWQALLAIGISGSLHSCTHRTIGATLDEIPSAQQETVMESTSHRFHMGMTRRSYLDSARNRRIQAIVWYPAPLELQLTTQEISPLFAAYQAAPEAAISTERDRYPLVLLSHGNGGVAEGLAWLAETLVQNGFIVASLNHPGNTFGDTSPEGYARAEERPKDLSFLLDQFAADEFLGRVIAWDRIGSAGHSMGGYAALALSGLRWNLFAILDYCQANPTHGDCVDFVKLDRKSFDPEIFRASYRDPRIKAVFALTPAAMGAYDASDLADIRVPVEFVVAQQDEIIPFEGALVFSKQLTRATMRVLPNASHFTFLPLCTPQGKQTAPAICSDPEANARSESHSAVKQWALAFFQKWLPSD